MDASIEKLLNFATGLVKSTSAPSIFFLSAVDDVGLLGVDERHRAGLEADQSRHIT